MVGDVDGGPVTFGAWSAGRLFFIRQARDGSCTLMREDGRWSLYEEGALQAGQSDGKTLCARLAGVDAELRRLGHELEDASLLPHQTV